MTESCNNCPTLIGDRRKARGRRYEDKVDPRFKVAYLLSVKKVESSLLLAVAAFALALGFLFGDGSNANYALIYGFAEPIYWSVFFFVYSFFKFYGVWYNLDHRARILTSAAGLWAWNYILLSFTAFDTTPMAPTELLLGVPVIVEMWVATAVAFCKKKKV